jgi:hypothetical protein
MSTEYREIEQSPLIITPSPVEQKRRDFVLDNHDITEDDYQKLQSTPGFTEDLDKILALDFVGVERVQFLQKYGIKLISKTSDGRDFVKLTEKEVDGLPRAEKKKYYAWLEARDNATIMKTDWEIAWEKWELWRAEKEKEDEKKIQNNTIELLTSQVATLKNSLDPTGNKVIEEGVAEIRSNPWSPEYTYLLSRGIKAEDIRSGASDSLITSLYAVRYSDRLSQYIIPEKKKDFEDSITNMAGILGIERKVPKDVQAFLQDSLVSGERKERTLTIASKLIDSGKYRLSETTYNPSTGYITFRGRGSREIAQIDTSTIPPQVEYGMRWLSLRMSVETERISEAQTLRERWIADITQDFSKMKNEKFITLVRGYSDLDQDELAIARGTNFLDYYQTLSREDIQNPDKRAALLANLKAERERVDDIPPGSPDEAIMTKHNDAKFLIKTNIESLERDIANLGKRFESLPDIPKSKIDTSREKAGEVLQKLIDLGYDELGQENLDTLMRSLRTGNNGIWIWSSGSIDMRDTTLQDLQMQELENIAWRLANSSGKKRKEAMAEIRESIKKNESFRNLWNSPVGLSTWISKQK